MAWGLHTEEVDLTWAGWASEAAASAAGELPKTTAIEGGVTYYFKTSSYDPKLGFYGVEAQNELVASRMLDCLGVPHAHYELYNARFTMGGHELRGWVAKAASYIQPGDERIAFGSYCMAHGIDNGMDALKACKVPGLWEGVCQMIVVDYLVANRDRHASNVELLLSADGKLRLAPLFDFGLSFVAPYAARPGAIASFDPLRRLPANNAIGTTILDENLSLVDLDVIPGTLDVQKIDHILSDLGGVLPQGHLEKTAEMLERRWARYEELRDLKG